MTTEREDLRGEWYREFAPHLSAGKPRLPLIFWLGMALYALWFLLYPYLYFSLPWTAGYSRGFGGVDECRPWAKVCEPTAAQVELEAQRNKLLGRVAALPLDELPKDAELADFIRRAASVPYAEQCATCHGSTAGKRPLPSDVATLYRGIVMPTAHPFGLSQRQTAVSAKMLAVYAHLLTQE